MKIRFWGAAGTVTGSAYEVETLPGNFMVDMGMFQGEDLEEKNKDFPEIEIAKLKFLLLTHAHLDHCGRVPMLYGHGFSGKIYMTAPTKELVEIVWLDAIKVAKSNQMLAVYTEDDVTQALNSIVVVEYGQVFSPMPGLKIKYYDAGHILGSSSIEIDVDEGGVSKRVIFSGDLGNYPSPLVKVTENPGKADYVVMESTYGDKLHQPRGEEEKIISECCRKIMGNNGTLLIPAFSLERTQEFLHIFDHLKKKRYISPDLSVFLDSPMGLRATAVFENYPQLYNEHMKEHFSADDPFDFPGLILVESARQSHQVTRIGEPKVIIAGSGMMTGGRVVGHAKSLLSLESTIVLFSGFQVPGTLGRAILDGEKEVFIEGERTIVAAEIVSIGSMSGHADQKQLMEWLGKISGISKVVLTHGENEPRSVLAGKVKESGVSEVYQPQFGEVVEL